MAAGRDTTFLTILVGTLFMASLTYSYAVTTERAEPLPEELENVDIVERRGDSVPLDLTFTDETGQQVPLRRYFDAERPVILVLGYYRCPMLCNLVLSGLIDGLKPLEWTPGQEFEIVSVSIDPTEGPDVARAKKENYLRAYGRPSAGAGFHFLTGKQEDIEKLAGAIGFKYRWVEERKEYAHAAVLTFVTPEGVISQYVYGVLHEPRTLRLALVDASSGTIGTALDRVLLYCFHYDSKTGQYTPAVMNLLKIGAILTVVLLGAFLLMLWRRDASRARAQATGALG
ncbi:MAG: SCO family protein [Acidobacteria bacterium]|nr:SCO family protein [Acidobacteriota bacterium]